MSEKSSEQPKAATFIDVMNDPEGRRLADAIEDTLGSLRGKDGDTELERILHRQVEELEQKTGFRYQLPESWG